MKLIPKSLSVVGLALAALAPLHAETIYGMTTLSSDSAATGVNLVSFDSAAPETITTIGSFSGLVAGHGLRSIDFRPATGQLYAISSGTSALEVAQIYTVNLATAALTSVGSGFRLTGNTSPRLEIDFNPVVDRIRILTGGTVANNFRAHPDTGALVATDTPMSWTPGDPLAGGDISIIGGAYSNNVAGALSTTLYGWEYTNDVLVTVGGIGGMPSPNGGLLSSINLPLTYMTFNSGLGMDISGGSGLLYVTHDDPNTGKFMSLYTRNLATGAETLLGAYPSGVFISDISAAPVPEPSALVLGTLGLLVLLANHRLRRRA